MKKLSITAALTALAIFAGGTVAYKKDTGGIRIALQKAQETVVETLQDVGVISMTDYQVAERASKREIAAQKAERYNTRSEEKYTSEIFDAFVKRPYLIPALVRELRGAPEDEKKKIFQAVTNAAEKFINEGCTVPAPVIAVYSYEDDTRPPVMRVKGKPEETCLPLIQLSNYYTFNTKALVTNYLAKNPGKRANFLVAAQNAEKAVKGMEAQLKKLPVDGEDISQFTLMRDNVRELMAVVQKGLPKAPVAATRDVSQQTVSTGRPGLLGGFRR